MDRAERLAEYIEEELRTRHEQGCETWELERKLALAGDAERGDRLEGLERIRRAMENLEPERSFSYSEPSDLQSIRMERPAGPRSIGAGISAQARRGKTLGGWIGRVAGCMLGKPVEGWDRQHIRDVLEVRDAYPLEDYFPPPGEGEKEQPGAEELRLLRGHVDGGVRDDDTDYTVLGLRIMERHGKSFTSRQVAWQWLMDLPFARTYTAERAAYRNFVNGIWPPGSATERNPYREWIGAQIRADAWGYACPGQPARAAELAYRDASISHRRNGIYGEMWVAAMLAAAFVTSDAGQVLRIGLSEIPQESRLSEAIRSVVRWREEDKDAEHTLGRVMENYGHYSRVHTINNAAIVATALLWGEGDFTRSVGLAVMGGLDTDCNGATVGSLLGTMLGAEGIPDRWKAPLDDRLGTAIAGTSEVAITELARRTVVVQGLSD